MMYFHNASTASSKVRAIAAQDAASADPTADIAALKQYVSKHMHSSVSFVLTNAYNRAVSAAQAQQQQQSSAPSGAVYAQAQAACASHADSVAQANCVINYVSAHSTPAAAPSTTPVVMPSLATYTYHFISPAWTFDLTGILLIIGLIGLIISIFWLILGHRKPKPQHLPETPPDQTPTHTPELYHPEQPQQ